MLRHLLALGVFVVTVSFAKITKAEHIYWADTGTNKIQRAELDGSNVTDLITLDQGKPVSLVVTDSFIYWINIETNKIQRAELDGSNVADLITLDYEMSDRRGIMEVTDSFIYWTDAGAKAGTNGIQRAELDGSNVVSLLTPTAGYSINSSTSLNTVEIVSNPVVKDGFIYWTNYNYYVTSIERASLDGSNMTEIAFIEAQEGQPQQVYDPVSGSAVESHITPLDSSYPSDMEVTDSFIYWADSINGGTILRCNLDGSDVITLVKKGEPSSIEIHNSQIYWTDPDGEKIYRADLDGSNIEILIEQKDGLEDPRFIDIN